MNTSGRTAGTSSIATSTFAVCTAAEAKCYFMARWLSADVLPTRLGGKLGKDIEKVQKHLDLNDACDEAAILRAESAIGRSPAMPLRRPDG